MNPPADHLAESAAAVRRVAPAPPEVTLVLGSGLGDFAERIPDPIVLSGDQVPHFPRSTVEGHKGKLIFGEMYGIRLLVLQGRVHFYETGDLHSILYPLLLAHSLGARTLLLTNAAGGINRAFLPGDLMLITDIMNLTMESVQIPELPADRSHTPMFDPGLSALALSTAEELGLRVHSGVYAGVKGPSYETAAEVEMINRLGGDAVGMSTVHEAQMAYRLGMRLVGISCITNLATGLTPNALSHEEVKEVGQRAKSSFGRLVEGIIKRYKPATRG